MERDGASALRDPFRVRSRAHTPWARELQRGTIARSARYPPHFSSSFPAPGQIVAGRPGNAGACVLGYFLFPPSHPHSWHGPAGYPCAVQAPEGERRAELEPAGRVSHLRRASSGRSGWACPAAGSKRAKPWDLPQGEILVRRVAQESEIAGLEVYQAHEKSPPRPCVRVSEADQKREIPPPLCVRRPTPLGPENYKGGR